MATENANSDFIEAGKLGWEDIGKVVTLSKGDVIKGVLASIEHTRESIGLRIIAFNIAVDVSVLPTSKVELAR